MTKLKGIFGRKIRSTLASQENLECTGQKALRHNAQVDDLVSSSKLWREEPAAKSNGCLGVDPGSR